MQIHEVQLAERFEYILQILLGDAEVYVAHIEAVEGNRVRVRAGTLGASDLAILFSFGKLYYNWNT